jgi:hypothetical protein
MPRIDVATGLVVVVTPLGFSVNGLVETDRIHD